MFESILRLVAGVVHCQMRDIFIYGYIGWLVFSEGIDRS